MFERLVSYLDYCLRQAQQHPESAKAYFDQAFGAVQYQAYFDIDFHKDLVDLWENYRPKFEKAVWG